MHYVRVNMVCQVIYGKVQVAGWFFLIFSHRIIDLWHCCSHCNHHCLNSLIFLCRRDYNKLWLHAHWTLKSNLISITGSYHTWFGNFWLSRSMLTSKFLISPVQLHPSSTKVQWTTNDCTSRRVNISGKTWRPATIIYCE